MEETYSIKKAIIFVIIILIIIGAFYGITLLVTNNKKEEEPKKDDSYVSIQYEEIVVGNIYKQNESEYYVLATTKKDNNSDTYMTNYRKYASKTGATKSYTIDLDSGFNKKYLSDNSDFSLSLPIFKTTTLLKISDKKIIESYEGNDITNILETMNNNVKE